MKRLYIGLKNKIEHFFDVSLAKDVHQFKPSIVAIQDDPASPAGRIVAWTLCLIILTAIIWSCIAKIDIIATATGQIVPVGNTKVIQSHIDATIKNINIKEGDFVKKGDLLIELDDERYSSEKESLEKMLAAENVKYNRANAMLNYIDRQVIEKLPLVEFQSISPRLQEMLFEQEYRDLDSSVSMLNEMIDQKKYELESVVNNINHYKQTVNLTEIRAKKFKGLLEQKVSSELEFMEFEEKRIREKNELNTLISREKQTAANIKELNEKVKYTIIENKKRQLATIEESFNNINKVKEEINKNEILIKYSKITSPVNGYIQELKFHTIGGVMEQAQEVLKIVEDKSDIEVETMVLSKDIGFVHKGMEVAIKVDSFLFTKYGLVHGTVTNISEDAIKDEKMGLVYKTKIKLKEKTVHVDGKEIDLSYGMGVTSEIKTGTRTVMEFFLSPIIKKMNESINER